MTQTLPGADIRGYYASLDIHLPEWSHDNAPTRCFADPEGHTRGDRSPSTSVSLIDGSWCCHGCSARGGAFDAAVSRGHTRRGAVDLMIEYGLTRRRTPDSSPRRDGRFNRVRGSRRVDTRPTPQLNLSERDVARWHQQLIGHQATLRHLRAIRGWSEVTIRELQLGLDRGRITIPIRDENEPLIGLLRYNPDRHGGMRAAFGSRRALFPHPDAEPSPDIVLVEGEPDAIAGRSRGLHAIAIPGIDSWKEDWASTFRDRVVTVILDADQPGRRAAAAVARDLRGHARKVMVLDIAPDRADGYDLTDWLLGHAGDAVRLLGDLADKQ